MNSFRSTSAISIVKKTILLSLFLICSISLQNVQAGDSGVTKTEVINYLSKFGIKVETCSEELNGDDWKTYNYDGSRTIVYVENSQIVGHEDLEI